MNKPNKHTKSAYDYHECAQYVESILGYELRDTLGVFTHNRDGVEHRDFWLFLVNSLDHISNGSYFSMEYLKEDSVQWAQDILEVFYKEFGEDATYWVDW